MELELLLESLDSLDAAYHTLYIERDGKFHLNVKGATSPEQTKALKDEAGRYRIELKDANDKLAKYAVFGDDVEAIHTKLDRIDELEAAAGDKIDEAKMTELVEARLRTKLAPIERQLETALKDSLDKDVKINDFESKDRTRLISDHVREAAVKSKLIGTAVDDALVLAERMFDIDDSGTVITKDNVGVTPGVTADVWLTDMQATRPHWWPDSQGGGSRGSGTGQGHGKNPFSRESWNLTEQGQLVRADAGKADQMAKAAGTSVGGGKPAEKK